MRNALKLSSLCLVFLIASSFQNNDNIIVWSKEKKLTWNDFQGKISNDKTYEVINVYKESEEDAARSRVAIALYYQCEGSKAKHTVRAEFEKNNSWYFAKRKTDAVLSHEQLHFDITELYARKLRAKLASMKNPCDKPSVGIVYQANENAFVEFTKQYDTETSHGVNKQKQSEWEIKVQNLLSGSN
jgi:hypothetical protein